MENRKGSGVFLGVIGVATLIVAIIGATFAYFSATTPGNIRNIAGAATLSLGYNDNLDGIKTAMIPVADNVALYSVEYAANSVAKTSQKITSTVTHAPSSIPSGKTGQCYDDAGNEICSYFEFDIYNPSKTTTQNVEAYLTVVTNGLPDLYFRIYDENWNPVKIGTDNTATTGIDEAYVGDFPQPAEADDESTEGIDETKPTVTLPGLARTLLPSNKDTKDAILESDPVTRTENGVTVKNDDGSNQQNKYKYYMIVWIHETGQAQSETHEGGIFAANITFTSGSSVENGVTGTIAMSGKTTAEPNTP